MAFRSPRHDVCIVCQGLRNGSEVPETARRNDLPPEAKIYPQVPVHTHGVILDVISMEAITKRLTSIVEPVQRCECCWETRHVRRDAYAATMWLCARCELQITRRGCCRLHNSRVVYPELMEGQPLAPVDEPLEVTMMFADTSVRKELPDDAQLMEPDL